MKHTTIHLTNKPNWPKLFNLDVYSNHIQVTATTKEVVGKFSLSGLRLQLLNRQMSSEKTLVAAVQDQVYFWPCLAMNYRTIFKF